MMKIEKLTSEKGDVKFEVYQNKETPHSWDSYVFSMTASEVKELKAALNAREDI